MDELEQSEFVPSIYERPSIMDRSNDSRSYVSSKSRSRSRSNNSFYNFKSYCQRNDSKSRRSSFNPTERAKLNFERSASGCLPSYPQISTRQKDQSSREVQAPSIIRKQPITLVAQNVSDFNSIPE